jgi:hypothetical protein
MLAGNGDDSNLTTVDVEYLLPEKRCPRWDTGIELHRLKGDALT